MALLQLTRAAFKPLIVLGLLAACEHGHAHGGGLNADGCHNNRRTGDYHCHRAPSPRSSYGTAAPLSSMPSRSPSRSALSTSSLTPTNRAAPDRNTALDGVDPLLRLVMRVQAALLSKGYDPGIIDGNLGRQTHAALRAFQADQGLGGNGALTSETIAALGVRTN